MRNGVRYSPEADLDLAIAEYQARRKLLSEDDAQVGRIRQQSLSTRCCTRSAIDELRETLREADAEPDAARAADHHHRRGTRRAAAIEASRALVSSEADRRTALASAGNILTRLREYAGGRRSHRGQHARPDHHRCEYAAHRDAAQDEARRWPLDRAQRSARSRAACLRRAVCAGSRSGPSASC